MEKDQNRLQYLFQQYLSNKINEDEYAELWNLLQADAKQHNLSDELQSLWERVDKATSVISKEEWNEKIERLIGKAEAEAVPVRKIPLWKTWRWIAAASIIIILVIGGGIFLSKKKSPTKDMFSVHAAQQKDIAPGGNKAVLTLANGKTIMLDSAAKGAIAQQGNTQVLKLNSGQISYQHVKTHATEAAYNTLAVPRGGKYQIILPDGSKVWLNAASSIRFPTAFNGNDRDVEITGEAYFEIAKNPDKPFIVKLLPSLSGERQGEVEVLGTHFNVDAYNDEPTAKVTLLEGKVRVSQLTTGSSTSFRLRSTNGLATSQILEPGQQAQLNKEGSIKVVNDADINEAVAWKNDLFWFNDSNIQEVMRQLSRWYNVDVVIKGNITKHFTGSIPRNVNVSKVFEVLQATGGIHFEIQNGKIIVSP